MFQLTGSDDIKTPLKTYNESYKTNPTYRKVHTTLYTIVYNIKTINLLPSHTIIGFIYRTPSNFMLIFSNGERSHRSPLLLTLLRLHTVVSVLPRPRRLFTPPHLQPRPQPKPETQKHHKEDNERRQEHIWVKTFDVSIRRRELFPELRRRLP